MTFRNFEWRRAVLRSRELSPATKLVAVAIAEPLIKKPSLNGDAAKYGVLAGACGLTERGVRASIASLVTAGYLAAHKRGFGASNTLTLTRPQSVTAMTDWEAANPSPPCRIEEPPIRHGHDGQSGMELSPIRHGHDGLERKNLQEEERKGTLARPEGLREEVETPPPSANWLKEMGWELPEGFVAKGTDGAGARARIGQAAVQILGLPPKIGSEFADALVLAHLDQAGVLARMIGQCQRGTLAKVEVLSAMVALGIAGEIERRREAA